MDIHSSELRDGWNFKLCKVGIYWIQVVFTFYVNKIKPPLESSIEKYVFIFKTQPPNVPYGDPMTMQDTVNISLNSLQHEIARIFPIAPDP